MSRKGEAVGPPAHPSVKLTLYVPGWLVSMAKAKGVNLSRVMTAALSRELGVAEDPTPRINALRAELEVLEAQLGLRMSLEGAAAEVVRALEGRGRSPPDRMPEWFPGWWSGRHLEFPSIARMTASEVWPMVVKVARDPLFRQQGVSE